MAAITILDILKCRANHRDNDEGDVDTTSPLLSPLPPPTSFYFYCQWCGEDTMVNAQAVTDWHKASFCTEGCQLAYSIEVVPAQLDRIKAHMKVLKRVHDDLATQSKQVVETFDASHPGDMDLSVKKRHRACPTSPRYDIDAGSAPMPGVEGQQLRFSLDLDYTSESEEGERNE